jgi:integrase
MSSLVYNLPLSLAAEILQLKRRKFMPIYRHKWKDKKTGKIRLGSYYYKFTLDGETYRETVKTARNQRQAEQAELDARRRLHEGIYGTRASRLPFEQFVKEIYLPWAEQHHRSYQDELWVVEFFYREFGDLPLGKISQFTVESFKLKLAKAKTKQGTLRKPSSVNMMLGILSIIFSYAVKLKHIRENPCSGVKRLPLAEEKCRYLLPEEEERLLPALEQDRPFLKPLTQMAIWTGFRQNELITFEKGDADFARNLLFVRDPNGRKDKRRTHGVPMSPEVRELVARLISESPIERIFHDQGKPLTRRIVDQAFRRACQKAGVRINFHALRHTFGTRLAEQNVNLKKIAQLMGHSNTRMTERYVHPSEEGLAEAVRCAVASGNRQNSSQAEVKKIAQAV